MVTPIERQGPSGFILLRINYFSLLNKDNAEDIEKGPPKLAITSAIGPQVVVATISCIVNTTAPTITRTNEFHRDNAEDIDKGPQKLAITSAIGPQVVVATISCIVNTTAPTITRTNEFHRGAGVV